MKKINIGIIGAGWVANEHLKALRFIDWINVSGITSRTISKAEQLAKFFGIKNVCITIDELVNKCKPDALLVLVSAEEIFSVAKKVLNIGIPVFVEKPAGLLPSQNYELAEIAEKKSTRNLVGFNRRFYSVFRKGAQIIKDSGALLGMTIEGHERIWRIKEGGKTSNEVLSNWIFANSTHTIDLVRFFAGEVKSCRACAKTVLEQFPDNFAALIETDRNVIVQYTAFWNSPGGWTVKLFGNGVTVEYKPLEKGVWINRRFESTEIPPDEDDLKCKPGFIKQMEAFGKLVSDNIFEWPMLDLAGSYLTMDLASKISSTNL